MKLSQLIISGIIATGLMVSACNPKKDKEVNLPAPSLADPQVVPYVDILDPTNKNSFIVTDNTPGSFISSWDYGGGATNAIQPIDTPFFAYKGVYLVTLYAASQGGITKQTVNVTVDQNSPYAADFTITNTDLYHYTVTVTTPNPKKITWVLPTGDTSSKATASFYWPFADTMKVSLTTTASNNGISTITKSTIISTDDPSNPLLNDPFLMDLTGGPGNPKGKTWVLSLTPGGNGPLTDSLLDYSSDGYAGWNILTNEFTFKFEKYQFIPKNQNVTVYWKYNLTPKFGNLATGDYANISQTDPNEIAAPFIVYKKAAEVPLGSGIKRDVLRITNGSYWGWYVDRYDYEVMSHTPTTIVIRQGYADDPKSNPGRNQKDDYPRRYFTYNLKK